MVKSYSCSRNQITVRVSWVTRVRFRVKSRLIILVGFYSSTNPVFSTGIRLQRTVVEPLNSTEPQSPRITRTNGKECRGISIASLSQSNAVKNYKMKKFIMFARHVSP